MAGFNATKFARTQYDQPNPPLIRTTVTISQSTNVSQITQPFSLHVRFTSEAGEEVTDLTGLVEFYDGIRLLGTSNVDATGQASLIIRTLTVGSHSLFAYYRGDLRHAPANSYSIGHLVKGGIYRSTRLYIAPCHSNILINGSYVCVGKS